MGELSINLCSGVKAAVHNCFASINSRVIFISKSILPIADKDVVPDIKKMLFMKCSATVTVGT